MSSVPPPSPSDQVSDVGQVFDQLFQENPLPLVVTSLVRDAILAVNRRAIEVFGELGIDAVGGPASAFYADPAERASVLRAMLDPGYINDRKLRLRRRDGSPVWVLLSSRRITWNGEVAGLAGFVDLTPRLQAEQRLATSEHRLAEQSRTLTALTERSASEPEAFEDRIDEILRMASATLGVARLSLWRFTNNAQSIECVALFQGAPARHAIGSRIRREECPPYFDALEAERVIAAHDARTDPRTSGFTTWYLDPNGIGAMLDVPVRYAGGTRGVLCAEHVGGARTWTLDEQNFAVAVSNLIAVAAAESEQRLANAHVEESRDRLDRELASAGDMQKIILPQALPVDARVQFAALYHTSRHAGGDYYDVIPIDAHRIALVVVDVSGHGARAAIVMAMIRAVIHTDCGPLADPAAVLQRLNRHFRYLWDTSMHATAIAAVLDVERGVLRLSSAGHPAPFVIREGQVTSFPAINGPLLFWDELADPVVVEERLQPGDRVVFYTDGITDRIGPGDTRFDTPRMMETFSRSSRLDLASMVNALNVELDAFASGEEPDDDQTVLAIELK